MKKILSVLICYSSVLLWTHYLIRDSGSIDYLKQYVVARCTALYTSSRNDISTAEDLSKIHASLERCQNLEVKIDGVWGGLFGNASVRLKVTYDSPTEAEYKYYAVAVSRVSGLISVSHELESGWYYLNL